MACSGGGTAQAGQYANLGSAEGKDPNGLPVVDEDPSHYFGADGIFYDGFEGDGSSR